MHAPALGAHLHDTLAHPERIPDAVEELLRRVRDVRLQPGAEITYHSAMDRAPVSVPIAFTPGPRSGS